MADVCCGPGYASPQAAMKAEPEKLLYALIPLEVRFHLFGCKK